MKNEEHGSSRELSPEITGGAGPQTPPIAALQKIDQLATEFVVPDADGDDVEELLGDICEIARSSLAAQDNRPPTGWRETLNALAQRYLDQSNQRRQPQWQAKASAHAYAGVINSIHALDGLGDGMGGDPSPPVSPDAVPGTDTTKTITDLQAKIAGLEGENDTLRAALIEARSMVEAWGAYAGEYFQTKWDLLGDLQTLDDAIAKSEATR